MFSDFKDILYGERKQNEQENVKFIDGSNWLLCIP